MISKKQVAMTLGEFPFLGLRGGGGACVAAPSTFYHIPAAGCATDAEIDLKAPFNADELKLLGELGFPRLPKRAIDNLASVARGLYSTPALVYYHDRADDRPRSWGNYKVVIASRDWVDDLFYGTVLDECSRRVFFAQRDKTHFQFRSGKPVAMEVKKGEVVFDRNTVFTLNDEEKERTCTALWGGWGELSFGSAFKGKLSWKNQACSGAVQDCYSHTAYIVLFQTDTTRTLAFLEASEKGETLHILLQPYKKAGAGLEVKVPEIKRSVALPAAAAAAAAPSPAPRPPEPAARAALRVQQPEAQPFPQVESKESLAAAALRRDEEEKARAAREKATHDAELADIQRDIRNQERQKQIEQEIIDDSMKRRAIKYERTQAQEALERVQKDPHATDQERHDAEAKVRDTADKGCVIA